MPTAMKWYNFAAKKFGGVNPYDEVAVDKFFADLRDFPKEEAQEIFDFLLEHDGLPEPESYEI